MASQAGTERAIPPHPFKSIAITGASAGLGAALARALAAPGCHLALTGRHGGRLEAVADACRAKGANVDARLLDVTDQEALTDWIAASDTARPLDLFIANAGIFAGKDMSGALEAQAVTAELIATNLTAAITGAQEVARRMTGRGAGRIALVSSLAAQSPQADAPSYTASKAGLSGFAEALAEYLADTGVGVTLIEPGHIATAQAEAQVGRLPGLVAPEAAAAQIVQALVRGQGRLAFPFKIKWLIRLQRLLPRPLRWRLNRPYRFHLRPDLGATQSKEDPS